MLLTGCIVCYTRTGSAPPEHFSASTHPDDVQLGCCVKRGKPCYRKEDEIAVRSALFELPDGQISNKGTTLLE